MQSATIAVLLRMTAREQATILVIFVQITGWATTRTGTDVSHVGRSRRLSCTKCACTAAMAEPTLQAGQAVNEAQARCAGKRAGRFWGKTRTQRNNRGRAWLMSDEATHLDWLGLLAGDGTTGSPLTNSKAPELPPPAPTLRVMDAGVRSNPLRSPSPLDESGESLAVLPRPAEPLACLGLGLGCPSWTASFACVCRCGSLAFPARQLLLYTQPNISAYLASDVCKRIDPVPNTKPLSVAVSDRYTCPAPAYASPLKSIDPSSRSHLR
jgi:hypothetical protein